MKTVAVLGGGPAGASAAERLADAGLRTILMDEKLAWEKPCGGGLTHKAYSQYPFLIENSTPKRIVTESVLAAPKADADFCVVATGARNPLRDVGTQLTPPDTMSALGYYVQGDQAQIDIQFL